MIRSVLAVLAGYVAMAVLVVISTAIAVKVMLHASDLKSGMKLKPTPAYLAVNLTYSGAFALLGGFITASLAGWTPLGHALALAGLMLAMSVISFAQSAGSQQPKSYRVILTVLLPLCAVLGGYCEILRQPHP